MNIKEIRKVIYKERDIWKEAYPYSSDFINDFINKLVLELELAIWKR